MSVFRYWRKLIPPVLWTVLDVPGPCSKSGTAVASKTEVGLAGWSRSMEIRTWAAVEYMQAESCRIRQERRFCGAPGPVSNFDPVTTFLLPGNNLAGASGAGSIDARQLLRTAPAAAEE